MLHSVGSCKYKRAYCLNPFRNYTLKMSKPCQLTSSSQRFWSYLLNFHLTPTCGVKMLFYIRPLASLRTPICKTWKNFPGERVQRLYLYPCLQITARPSAWVWMPHDLGMVSFWEGNSHSDPREISSKIPMDFNCAVICPESLSMLLIYICCW